jgi:hypothetical protein
MELSGRNQWQPVIRRHVVWPYMHAQAVAYWGRPLGR